MRLITANKLFKNRYQFKLIIYKNFYYLEKPTSPKKQYFKKLQEFLENTEDEFELSINYSLITIFTNVEKLIDEIIKIDENRVSSLSRVKSQAIIADTIFLPRIPFDYKISLRKSPSNHSSFINWAKSNKSIKLTKSCIRELQRDRSYGGTYFYVNGDNNLLLTQMQLGEVIGKIEKIVN